jgi:hypothetical protein
MLETDFMFRPLSKKKRLAIFKTRQPKPSFGIAQEPELPTAPSTVRARQPLGPAPDFFTIPTGPPPQLPIIKAIAPAHPAVIAASIFVKPAEQLLKKVVFPLVTKQVVAPILRTVTGAYSKLPWASKDQFFGVAKGRPGPTDVIKTLGSGVTGAGTAIEAFEIGGGVIPLATRGIDFFRRTTEIPPFPRKLIERAVPVLVDLALEEAGLAPWTPTRPFRRPEASTMGHPDAGTALELRPRSMGLMPGPDAIVKQWHANGINFWRTVDGWIYVQRLDGTIKRYRPYKSVVLGKRPSSKQVNRAINKLKSEHKIYRKLTALFAPKRRS